jgi:hypothetical protein
MKKLKIITIILFNTVYGMNDSDQETEYKKIEQIKIKRIDEWEDHDFTQKSNELNDVDEDVKVDFGVKNDDDDSSSDYDIVKIKNSQLSIPFSPNNFPNQADTFDDLQGYLSDGEDYKEEYEKKELKSLSMAQLDQEYTIDHILNSEYTDSQKNILIEKIYNTKKDFINHSATLKNLQEDWLDQEEAKEENEDEDQDLKSLSMTQSVYNSRIPPEFLNQEYAIDYIFNSESRDRQKNILIENNIINQLRVFKNLQKNWLDDGQFSNGGTYSQQFINRDDSIISEEFEFDNEDFEVNILKIFKENFDSSRFENHINLLNIFIKKVSFLKNSTDPKVIKILDQIKIYNGDLYEHIISLLDIIKCFEMINLDLSIYSKDIFIDPNVLYIKKFIKNKRRILDPEAIIKFDKKPIDDMIFHLIFCKKIIQFIFNNYEDHNYEIQKEDTYNYKQKKYFDKMNIILKYIQKIKNNDQRKFFIFKIFNELEYTELLQEVIKNIEKNINLKKNFPNLCIFLQHCINFNKTLYIIFNDEFFNDEFFNDEFFDEKIEQYSKEYEDEKEYSSMDSDIYSVDSMTKYDNYNNNTKLNEINNLGESREEQSKKNIQNQIDEILKSEKFEEDEKAMLIKIILLDLI